MSDPQYRPLGPDEVIQEGDEYWSGMFNRWSDAKALIGNPVSRCGPDSKFRRPIIPAPEPKREEAEGSTPISFADWWQGSGKLNCHKRDKYELAELAWKLGAAHDPSIVSFKEQLAAANQKQWPHMDLDENNICRNCGTALMDHKPNCLHILKHRAELAESQLAVANERVLNAELGLGLARDVSELKPGESLSGYIKDLRNRLSLAEQKLAEAEKEREKVVAEWESYRTSGGDILISRMNDIQQLRLENAALRKAVELVAADIQTTMYRLSKPAEAAILAAR